MRRYDTLTAELKITTYPKAEERGPGIDGVDKDKIEKAAGVAIWYPVFRQHWGRSWLHQLDIRKGSCPIPPTAPLGTRHGPASPDAPNAVSGLFLDAVP